MESKKIMDDPEAWFWIAVGASLATIAYYCVLHIN